MYQRHLQHNISKTIKNRSSLVDLLMRIHMKHLHDKQEKRLGHFVYTYIYLMIVFFGLYIFGCHTRVYNALSGPFHLTLDQFSNYLDKYNDINLEEKQSNSNNLLFHHEYLQIELGENKIEQDPKHILYIYLTNSPNSEKISYILHRVKEKNIVVNLHPNKLYVKLPSSDQNHFHKRHPFHFSSFKVSTLRCIVRQLDVLPNEYMQWIEKSMYIKTIEKIYAQNITAFNIKVISKCGIFIGYLDRLKNELAYSFNSKNGIKFHKLDVVFDASSSYYPYKTFLFGGLLLSWLFVKAFVYLVIYLFYTIYRTPLCLHPRVQNILTTLQINTLQELNDLLIYTNKDNNYYDRLFLVRNRYLLILNIDWNAFTPYNMRYFYIHEPLTIISLKNIVSIKYNKINTKYNFGDIQFSLPIICSKSDKYGAQWLHQRLMTINETYRQHYDEQERIQIEARRQQQEAEDNQRRLDMLIAEEEQYQSTAYQNDYELLWNNLTPASPRFIAQFRMMNSLEITHDLYDTSCTICLENFEYGEQYTEWPCDAKHVFHRNCMLKVLRTQNTCPLCRHPVERSDLALRLIFRDYLYRIFI